MRLRTSGAATPATTIPQAVALIALDSRTGGLQYMSARSVAIAARGTTRGRSWLRAGGARPRTSDATTVLAASASGCHCTPSTKLPAGSSIASGSSSSVESPLTRGPPPAGRRPGGGGTWSRARPPPRRARPASPRVSVTSWSAPVEGADARAGARSWPKRSGRCCDERAAAGDVDQLHPPADPQHGHVALDRPAHERDLEGVALGHRVDRLGVRALAVAGGVDVGAAREHSPSSNPRTCSGSSPARSSGAASARGRRRAGPRRRSCSGSSAAGWSHTLQRARSSAAAHTDHRTSHAPHHRINGNRRRPIAAEPLRKRITSAHDPEESHERDRLRARDGQHAPTGVGHDRAQPPEALNAWNRQFGEDLLRRARPRAPRTRRYARCVLTGAGRAFSSGADLKDIAAARRRRTGRPTSTRCSPSATTRSCTRSARCPSR